MFVGHGLLAFAIAAAAAHAAGWSRERALFVGLLAGAFGLAPDVDMLYAPMGAVGASGFVDAAGEFWSVGNQIHRDVTHSLITGSVVAAAAGAWATRSTAARTGAFGALAGLTAVATFVSGPVGGGVTVAFAASALALAEFGRRRGLDARTVGSAAAVGLLTHPFGDLLTGEPPMFLYPFDLTLVAARPEMFADPTLNLLAPLFLELATAWLALLVYLRVDGRGVGDYLAARATLGVAFAGAVFILPAPTLDVSYHFVFPLLAVGALVATPLPLVDVRCAADLRTHCLRASVSAVVAVTLAALAYTVVYLGL